MKKVLMFVVALTLALFATSALAQTSTTGSIEGTVTDQNGAAVPGMTVTATSPNLITPQSATSDDNGHFQILNIPPGTYKVAVEAAKGFAKYEKADVVVNLDKTASVEVGLTLATATANVTVTAAAAGLDVTSNTSGSNVSTEQFSNFPTARTVQGLYTIAPTATRSGLKDASGRDRDPSIGGSSGPENNYILDGVQTSDPAFGGAGANLPFEFVQEVEIKTGAFGAEYGKSTGGIFNVITKSGGNQVHGDLFGFLTTKGMVRGVKNIPFTGAIPKSFSEIDAGGDVGGPIKKDKLWFFAAFNPQRRTNQFLTQTLLQPVENKITTPFYAGKLTWGISHKHTLTLSTFGDFTKQEGFLFRLNARVPDSGFGNLDSFRGTIETGGSNYAGRLNSTFTPRMTGEFMVGLHFQRANTIPVSSVANQSLITDLYSVVKNGAALPAVDTNFQVNAGTNFTAYVDGRGGLLVRNLTRSGFGLVSKQNRDRWEGAARMQNIYGKHTIKYGFEISNNSYKILTTSSGPARTFADPFGEENFDSLGRPVPAIAKATTMAGGARIQNRFGVCTAVNATTVQCPTSGLTNRLALAVANGVGPAGITTVATNAALTDAQLTVNPILVLNSIRVRDFFLNTGSGKTSTRVEGFYVQDDWKLAKNLQLNLGVRWDYQQAYGTSSTYLKFNSFWDNTQPRLGIVYDFTGRGKGKVFANFARYLETPIPLDVNVRAGGDEIQLDKHINASRLNAPPGSYILAGAASGLGCLGCEPSPVDTIFILDAATGLERAIKISNHLRPQTIGEATGGFEYEARPNFVIGARYIYRYQINVIEDGSLDDGTAYFLFNPGQRGDSHNGLTAEDVACDPNTLSIVTGTPVGCFGPARRYYRAVEITATKRFSNHYQFIASYVRSSLIGNYEGLFRNDNGQSDPNITSLFDLPELLPGTYGRLPNDRPNQFKFNGSYETPFKLMLSGNFYIQSGIPFNELVPHAIYGENEGFGVPRGTAKIPANAAGGIKAGSTRTPRNYQLDFGAYYPIQMGENRQLRLQFDWFNVTNNQNALRVDETVRFSTGIPGAAPGRFLNPYFGTGLIFQFPSTMRLGAKFTF